MAITKTPSVKDASIAPQARTGRRVTTRTKPPAEKTAAIANLSVETTPSSPLVPVAPETRSPDANTRKRLSKAFSRPLDKKLKKETLVRERFTIPEAEYVQFARLKKRLLNQEIAVKKSELLRAGLILLSALDDEKLKDALTKVHPGN